MTPKSLTVVVSLFASVSASFGCTLVLLSASMRLLSQLEKKSRLVMGSPAFFYNLCAFALFVKPDLHLGSNVCC